MLSILILFSKNYFLLTDCFSFMASCVFRGYSICSFCLMIGSNTFQVFLRTLQCLIFLCDLPSWCLSWSVSLRQEALLGVWWPLLSVLLERGALQTWQRVHVGTVGCADRWSGDSSNKWQMALSGDCLCEVLSFLRAESSNWTGCQHSGSRTGKVSKDSTIQHVEFHFILFWVLFFLTVLNLPGAWSPESSRGCTSDFLWAGCVVGWIEKEGDRHVVRPQRHPLFFQPSPCFGPVPFCISPKTHSCPTFPVTGVSKSFVVLQRESAGCLLACLLVGSWAIILLSSVCYYSFFFPSPFCVKTSHPLLCPPVLHAHMLSAFLGFEKERR